MARPVHIPRNQGLGPPDLTLRQHSVRCGPRGLPVVFAGLALVLGLLPGPVRAECLGDGCYDGLVLMLGLFALGILVAFAVILFFLPRRLRIGVLWLSGMAALASIAMPMLDGALQDRQLRAMEAAEIVGPLPDLATRRPLIIADPEICDQTTCAAAVSGFGQAGVIGLRLEALEGVDLSVPLALADLPLELWRAEPSDAGPLTTRALGAAERQEAAAAIDYVVFTRSYHLTETGPMDGALQTVAGVPGLGEDSTVRLFMAKLPQGEARLSLTDLKFDLLDLWLLRRRHAVPLFLGGMKDAINTGAGQDALADALCGHAGNMAACREWTYY